MNALAPTRTIHVATDHAGFSLKEASVRYLKECGYSVVDHGAFHLVSDDDFPDFINLAAAAVSMAPEASCGVIFGGSGQGEAMLANRYPGVRATVFYGGDTELLKLSREHNDANVLSLGARFLTEAEALAALQLWLTTAVSSQEKYKRRNKKIEAYTRALRAS